MVLIRLYSIKLEQEHTTFAVLMTKTTNVTCFILAGDVAALIRSHMNGLQPFESITEQTTKTMPLALKQ